MPEWCKMMTRSISEVFGVSEESTTDSLTHALARWDREAARQQIAESVPLHEEFLNRFPIDAWPEMPLERYALGQEAEGGTYCWWLEFKTPELGSIRGGSAAKHLIWLGSDGSWHYPYSYGSVNDAWTAVRAAFVEALQLAAEGRYEEIDSIAPLVGAAALRTKTLFMYFPEHVLPIFSKAHIDHFLRQLGDPARNWSAVRANRHLLDVLRRRPELEGFSNPELMKFLYYWADPRTAGRIVKIAPGERAAFWDDCLAGGYICVGWDEVGDLAEFTSKESFKDAFRARYPYNGSEAQVSRKANEVWTLMELEPGDKVVANRGTSEILAVGTVTDAGYRWATEREQLRHTIGIDWDTSFARQVEPVKAWATTTVSKVSAKQYKDLFGDAAPPKAPDVDQVYLEIESAIARRRQVILYGPPGTGKTYAARRAAVWLLDGGSASPDAAAILADDAEFVKRERRLGAERRAAQVWFMVASPSHWSWSRLATERTVDFSLGRIQRNYPRVRAGDLVVGYESSPTQRVVVLARVISEFDPDGPSEAALTLEHVVDVQGGLTWVDLQSDPVLGTSEPVRSGCRGTLFALSAIESDRLVDLLIGRDPTVGDHAAPSVQRLTRITFHPSYTYEDFVEGFRPQASASGVLELTLTDGVFKHVCAAAASDPDRDYVVLIDEINRGNIPKIFGELITLIEADKRGLTVQLPQSGDHFNVPPNVAVIATMNTADRSIHLLDTALRRRFAFVELLPDGETLAGAAAGPLALDVFLETLNDAIRERVGREKQVGHAMFFDNGLPIENPDVFAAAFRHELLPLLQEYLYEDYRELADLLGSDVIDPVGQRPTTLLENPEALCAALADKFGAAAKP